MFTSTLASAPAVAFSRTPRETQAAPKPVPGPQYEVRQALGLCATLPSSPRASFGVGVRSPEVRSSSPSPAEYAPSEVLGPRVFSSIVASAPAFSLKSRTPAAADLRASNPACNAYAVPPLVGLNASSALSTVPSQPAWSVRSRGNSSPGGARSSTPGPAAYGSPDDSFVRPATPSFALRSRGKSLTMGLAANDIGPAAYPDAGRIALAQRPSSPEFSLRPRTALIEEAAAARAVGPACNAYDVPPAVGQSKLWTNTGGAFSLRGRHAELRRATTPSPLDYTLAPTLGASSLSSIASAPSTRLASTGAKVAPVRSGSTPQNVGPNSYDVPCVFAPGAKDSPFKRSGGGFSLKSRTFHGSPDDETFFVFSPGPAAYGVPSTTSVRTAYPQPGFSRSARLEAGFEDKQRASTPGASLYNDAFSTRRSPSFSMRSRTLSPSRTADVLGPAAFNLQGMSGSTVRSPPSWTLKMRWRPDRVSDVPGPGSYGELVLPHLAQLLAATAHMRLASADSVRRSLSSANGPRARASSPTRASPETIVQGKMGGSVEWGGMGVGRGGGQAVTVSPPGGSPL